VKGEIDVFVNGYNALRLRKYKKGFVVGTKKFLT